MSESASPPRPLAAVVLAAGKGTRMKSGRHKVLHPIAGRPMIEHLLAALGELSPERTVVVVGEGREQLEAQLAGRATLVVQEPQLGTGHAVLAARDALDGFEGDLFVLFADTPLLRPETLQRMRAPLAEGAAVAVLGFRAADPTGYGRLLVEGGALLAIREDKDATAAERAVDLCNAGVMALAGDGVQNLRQRGAHAGALAGRKHDSQAGSNGHSGP
jgi:bifunctional UDP-N-acetylglucosamine pyrophosphorylase/glucosamine-1-phosphate N-acetyltransferase